jgi:hypothetical protein
LGSLGHCRGRLKILCSPFLQPGSLLAAARGRFEWPHNLYRLYWPLAQADSFVPGQPVVLPSLDLKESAWGLLALVQNGGRDGVQA